MCYTQIALRSYGILVLWAGVCTNLKAQEIPVFTHPTHLATWDTLPTFCLSGVYAGTLRSFEPYSDCIGVWVNNPAKGLFRCRFQFNHIADRPPYTIENVNLEIADTVFYIEYRGRCKQLQNQVYEFVADDAQLLDVAIERVNYYMAGDTVQEMEQPFLRRIAFDASTYQIPLPTLLFSCDTLTANIYNPWYLNRTSQRLDSTRWKIDSVGFLIDIEQKNLLEPEPQVFVVGVDDLIPNLPEIQPHGFMYYRGNLDWHFDLNGKPVFDSTLTHSTLFYGNFRLNSYKPIISDTTWKIVGFLTSNGTVSFTTTRAHNISFHDSTGVYRNDGTRQIKRRAFTSSNPEEFFGQLINKNSEIEIYRKYSTGPKLWATFPLRW